MKTLITLSTALLLSFVAPAYAANGPTPVNKSDRQTMMTKKKKHKKHGKKKKKMSRRNNNKGCGLGEN
jgi:predicted secreted Zn-dependent protease